ncbi:MAG: DUF2283 domain-containing protein [Acidimicrobiales bacterium]
MRIEYDSEADAAYIQVVDEISPGGVHRTVGCDPSEVGGMINLDFDADGRLLGIEVLDASKLLPADVIVRAEE